MSILKRYVELHPGSRRLASRAAEVFPNGVTHDIRHNTPFPLYVRQASGSHKTDVDGNELVDYVMGHGALLLGHNEPHIMEAVEAQLSLGTHFGASHEAEIRWGELVLRLVPSAERVRFTSSGTEATMMALRLARAYTGREKVLRLREHFHGWNDSVMGQPDAEGTLPASPGLPHGTLEASIVVAQNDAETLERTLREDGGDIAAMILEPTGAHWGTEPIDLGFVRAARELTARHGVVLIFDEVITGFRVSPGGAQQAYGITPDMTTMAKIVAGGLPGGCVAGRAEIIEQIAIRDSVSRAYTPGGRISHPGTFNANPLSAAAGIATLERIGDGEAQRRANRMGELLRDGMRDAIARLGADVLVYGEASVINYFVGPSRVGLRAADLTPQTDPRMLQAYDGKRQQRLRLAMILHGVDIPPFHGWISSVHTEEDVGATVQAFEEALRMLQAEGLA